jgi:hypothetical protein
VNPSFVAKTCRWVWERTRPPSSGRQQRFAQPRLEQLEERNLMSVDGSWTQLTLPNPPQSIGTMMLLSDGTVMAQGSGITNHWFQLQPDSTGNYANGTWSPLASMSATRLYFASNVLPNGNVFVQGGEYSSAGSFTNTGETYNPVTNTWTNNAPAPHSSFGDDPSEVITTADGTTKILTGYISGPQTNLYDPSNNTWSDGGVKLRNDQSDEESWTKLPNGDILSWDVFASISTGVFHAQIYDPNANTWSDASSSSDGSTLPLLSSPGVGFELGPGILLPDGRVLQLGANGNTALYDYTTNSWTAGPQIRNNQGQLLGADDAPAAILPDGQVIFAADHPLFNGPTDLFDFDPTTNTITQLTLPTSLQNNLNSTPSYTGRMLVLPTGQLLYTTGSQVWAFTPNDSADPSWQPTITGLSYSNGLLTLSGTQLNGISEGAAYGDDAEMSENYPIIQLQDVNTGNVYYARTSGWSTGVSAVGDPTTQTVNFTLPAGLPNGFYQMTSIANGISSAPVYLLTYQTDQYRWLEFGTADGQVLLATIIPLTPSQPKAGLPSSQGNVGSTPPPSQSNGDRTPPPSQSNVDKPPLPLPSNVDNTFAFLSFTPSAGTTPTGQAFAALDARGSTESNAFSPSVTYFLGKRGNSLLSSPIDGQSDAVTPSSRTAAVNTISSSDPFTPS